MNVEMLSSAIELAERSGSVFVSTADAAGLPHLAAAGQMICGPEGCVTVSEWFCPGTLTNLRDNERISLVVWDSKGDAGFQLLGKVEAVNETGILDGYDPEMESVVTIPQVRRELLVRVDKIIRFSQAPHSDLEE